MKTLFLIASAIIIISGNQFAQPSGKVKYDAQSKSIVVPEVKGSQIVTDGRFTEGEWNGAVNFAISENFEIWLLSCSGNLYVGLKYSGEVANYKQALDCVSEIYITSNGKEFYNLHSSARLAEGINKFSDDLKQAKYSVEEVNGWEANFGIPTKDNNLKWNGKEYRIALNKFTTRSLKIAGGILAVNFSFRKSGNFPSNYDFKNPDNWVELILPNPK